MPRTLRLLSLAALLTTGAATAMAAGGSVEPQSVTGTQTGSQQVGTPATGSATGAPTYTYPKGSAGTGMSAQSTGQYPAAVGPTGSHQPDATNPVRSNPSGGGGQDSGGNGGGGTGH